MRLKIAILFLMLILTGCMARLPSVETEEEPCSRFLDVPDYATVVEAVVEATDPVPFAVLYAGDNIAGALYEPVAGAYLGAWLGPGMSKQDFEAITGKKHAVFAFDMFLGEEFPATFILQSIAAQAAPLIVLRLPNSLEDDFPLTELAALAYELGNYNLPMFIVFNPLPSIPAVDPDDYVLLFRYARIIFRTYAPMSAFVWHSGDNLITPESSFYPGHDVVDWVSLPLLAPQGPEGFIVDIPAQLTPFYLNFQRYKPIMLLPVGVSHFSRRDYVYRVPEAAAEITRIYKTLRDSFPRVRLVVYGDHGNTTPQGDDFAITRELGTINAYKNAIADSHFLSRIEPGGAEGPIWLRSALHGYYYNGEIFIDSEILTGMNKQPNTTTEINGRQYAQIGTIRGLTVEIDHARQVIYLG